MMKILLNYQKAMAMMEEGGDDNIAEAVVGYEDEERCT